LTLTIETNLRPTTVYQKLGWRISPINCSNSAQLQ